MRRLGGPSGLGGWLILPMLSLIVSPIRTLILVLTTYVPIFTGGQWEQLTTPGAPDYHPLWAPLLILEISGNVFFVGFGIILLVQLFMKFHRFPFLYVVYLALNVAFIMGDMAFANFIPMVAAQEDRESVQELARAIVGAAIWIPYMLVSKRVKNTFVKHDDVDEFSTRDDDDNDEFDGR